MLLFNDRRDAGRMLAKELGSYAKKKETVVVGLARGGVIVADEVAKALELPLAVLVVRKIGAPDNEELALGALSETGEALLNEELVGMLGASPAYIQKAIEREKRVAQERSLLYRGKKAQVDFKNKTIILVDDGIATGASMEVAIRSMRKAQAKKIALAVPVAAPDSLKRLGAQVDETICLSSPSHFYAVGSFYREFGQTTDQEIIDLL